MRAQNFANFAGLWMGVEAALRVKRIRALPIGLRVLAGFGCGFAVREAFNLYNSRTYGPLLCAYFKKYSEHARKDLFDIKDEKRGWFYVDTRQYMNYDFEDLGHEYHAHHGPQPEGEEFNQSWLTEMSKYLKGQPNEFKSHPNYINYDFEFEERRVPTASDVRDIFEKPGEEQRTPDSLK